MVRLVEYYWLASRLLTAYTMGIRESVAQYILRKKKKMATGAFTSNS